jgi:hypothetical protein
MPAKVITLSDVRSYFRSAPLDVARVAIDLANEALHDRETRSRAMSANLAKARAAKKPAVVPAKRGRQSGQTAQAAAAVPHAPDTVGATAQSAD